jgi:hypothetical protein
MKYVLTEEICSIPQNVTVKVNSRTVEVSINDTYEYCTIKKERFSFLLKKKRIKNKHFYIFASLEKKIFIVLQWQYFFFHL